MFDCQIKTKCWLEEISAYMWHSWHGLAWRTMETNEFNGHSNDAKKNYRFNNHKRWGDSWVNGHKFSCISFPWDENKKKIALWMFRWIWPRRKSIIETFIAFELSKETELRSYETWVLITCPLRSMMSIKSINRRWQTRVKFIRMI